MPVDGSLYLLPGLIAEVRNTVLSQATGDDQPRPWTSVLQATLSLADQVVGNLPSARMPAPCGPRNCGHSNAGARPSTACTPAATRTDIRTNWRILRT